MALWKYSEFRKSQPLPVMPFTAPLPGTSLTWNRADKKFDTEITQKELNNVH